MDSKTNASFQMVADYEGDISTLFNEKVPEQLPLLATRNLVLFPGVIAPILIGRQASISLIKHVGDGKVFVVASQIDAAVENPGLEDVSCYGVYARLMKVIDMPNQNGNVTAIVQALGRCHVDEFVKTKPFIVAKAHLDTEILLDDKDQQTLAAVDELKTITAQYIKRNDDIMNDTLFALSNISNNNILVNFVATNLPFSPESKLEMLMASIQLSRLYMLLKIVHREVQYLELKDEIRSRTKEDLDQQQKEYFLHQQIREIKEELGDDEVTPERKEILGKIEGKTLSDDTMKYFFKELDKLDNYNPQSPDFATQLNYLQTFASLPWGVMTEDKLDIKKAERILNRDHYGMEKVKECILEYLAVQMLRKDARTPILCLYGPPGVGKTSLGKSIAEAMGRKYVRMSLGGIHDESEIRGHRRTYIGAMVGRILKNIDKAQSINPVFILDEIDKVTQNTINGDPSSALLEVLDPEQNNAFHDNYLDVDFDLSHVMFIATANDISTIPRPLLDRMELVEVSGYTTEEKYEIAKRYLVPKEIENNGFKGQKVSLPKATIEYIIERYTRESGVRQLEKQINKVFRKLALQLTREGSIEQKKIDIKKLETLLGNPPFSRETYQGNDYAGVVTGLAWTSVGGEILYIETSVSKGQGNRLTLTGNLGDVMKESATIALEYVKSHADVLGIDYRVFNNYNIHIHVPEGATPKDGPSAGITIATSLASALTQRKVLQDVAMTGEITLRGKVLPVGGIKEKLLAAKRAGIKHICICENNRKDVEEIPQEYLKGVDFHYVTDVTDVWDYALTKQKVKNPIVFTIDEKTEKL